MNSRPTILVTNDDGYQAQGIRFLADIMKKLASHPLTDMSVEQFTKDWEGQYGKGKLIHNL